MGREVNSRSSARSRGSQRSVKVPERRDSVQGLSPTSQRAFGLKEPAFGEDTRPSTAASQEPLPPLGDKRRPTSTGSRRSEEWDKSLGTGSAEMGNVTGRDVSKFVFAQHQADAAASVKFRPPGEGEMTDPATRRRMTVAESDDEDASDTMKYIGGGNAGAEVATAASPKAKKTGIDMGTQSDYRESETQTDFIWDPDIAPIDPDKPQPDVLFLKHAGLDFSGGWRTLNMLDLEKIDVAKERARVQAGLPPIDDPTQLAKRRAMMQEHEQNEWGWRDQELQVENDTQMDLLREGLALHVEAHAERTDQVLDGVAAKADAIAQRAYDKTSQRGVVEARENAKRRDAVYNPVSKTRNIIDEYANPGSDVYAPRTRLGHKRPVGVAAYEDVVPTSTKDSEQLMHIEERLGRNMMYTGDDPDEMRAHAEELAARVLRKDSRKKVSVFAAKKTTEERRAEEYTKQLAKLESTMEKHAESKRAHQEVEPSIVEVVERPPERPPTPDIADLIAEEQEVDPNLTLAEDVLQAILFFQRILRGRASQNTMFEGAERRRGLIEELVQGRKARRQEKRRKKEQLAERGVAGGSSALMAPDQLEIARIKKAHQQQLLAGAIENIFGAIVANGLDYLSSDLVRTRELERLRNIAEQANAERRERITQEKIKRAEALERQRQRRAKYDRVMAVHRSMAELVVADLLVAAQEQIALVRVEEEMRAEAEEERRLAALPKTSGAVVNDLLFGWLLPHVENESKDTAATISEEQYFRAAASAMASTLQTLFPREGDIAPTPRPT